MYLCVVPGGIWGKVQILWRGSDDDSLQESAPAERSPQPVQPAVTAEAAVADEQELRLETR